MEAKEKRRKTDKTETDDERDITYLEFARDRDGPTERASI